MLLAQQIVLVLLTVYILFSPLSNTSITFATAITLVDLLLQSVLLWYVSRSGNLKLGIAAELTLLSIVIESGLIVSGGPLHSPALCVVIVIPVTAFALGGIGFGLRWAAISFFAQFLLIGIGALGIQYPDPLQSQQRGILRALLTLFIFADVSVLVFIYATIARLLQHEREQQQQKYEFLATHDALTGAANRSKFMDRLLHALGRIQRNKKMVALIYLDLDGFKSVNDTLGHAAGDRVLQVVSERLREALRKVDTIARLGGDEFGIVLEDIQTAQEALAVAQRLLRRVTEPIAELPESHIGGSLGVALAPLHSIDGDKLTQMADQAMYSAKRDKNTVKIFDPARAVEDPGDD